MAADDLIIRLGLKGQAETSRGLNRVATDAEHVGTAAASAGAKARAMGAAFTSAGQSAGAGLAVVGRGVKYGAVGLVGLAAAGTKWGLSFNAQVESARLRFGLFTNDVDGLTKSVQAIDMKSAFNFGDLADAAALFGNSGIKDIPNVLQGAANAAAASGKGTEGLKSIVVALSQIQSKGKLSQEEINQLNEAGAPGAQRIIAKHFNLTAKELGNLGGQGLDAKEAIKALTDEWTSGRMAKAAEDQTKTLGGQWALLTGNLQKASGAATESLAKGLSKDILPAANRAVEQITRIMGKEGLSNEVKLRQARAVIRRELGPIADDILEKIDDADLAGKLQDQFETAMSRIATTAAQQAPHVVKSFVDAWLGAGPWAKLISGAWLAKKLGLGAGVAALLKGAGGKGGALGAATKGAPIPVWVVNSIAGPMPGAPGKASGVKGIAKQAWDKGGKYVPQVAAVVGATYAGHEVGKQLDLHDAGYNATRSAIDRFGLGSVFREDQQASNGGHNPATRALRGDRMFIENQFTITMDGAPVARGVSTSNAKKKARK